LKGVEKSGDFGRFLATENLKRHLILAILIFTIAFWLYIYNQQQKKKKIKAALGLVVDYRFSGKSVGGFVAGGGDGGGGRKSPSNSFVCLVDLRACARTWNFVFFCSYLVVMSKSFEYNFYILSLVGGPLFLYKLLMDVSLMKVARVFSFGPGV
jgi:hypothetical protein